MIDTSYSLPVFQTLQESWDRVKGAKGTIWLALLLFFAIMFGLGLIDGIVSVFIPRLEPLIGLINQVLGFLLGMGIMYIGIRRAQDLPISYDLLFRGFKSTLWYKIIGLYLLQLLILFIPMLVIITGVFIGIASSSSAVLTLGIIVCLAGILLTIYLGVRILLAMPFALDKEIAPFEALSLSFNATRSNFWNLIGILLLQTLIIIVSAIPLGIGLIWTMPFSYICMGMVYKKLSQHLLPTIITPKVS